MWRHNVLTLLLGCPGLPHSPSGIAGGSCKTDRHCMCCVPPSFCPDPNATSCFLAYYTHCQQATVLQSQAIVKLRCTLLKQCKLHHTQASLQGASCCHHIFECCGQADRDKRKALERAEREKTEAEEAAARQLAQQQAAESAKEADLKSTLQQKQQVLLHVITFLKESFSSQVVLLRGGGGGEGGWLCRGISISSCDTNTQKHSHPA